MNTITIANEILLEEVRRLLMKGSNVTIRAKGNSMLPFITGGKDRVTLAPAKELRTGDIVLAEITPGHYVLHRIVSLDGDSVTLMGDGNLRGMEHCTRKDITGTAVRVHKASGKTIDCTSAAARKRARIWKALLPVRRVLLAVWKRVV